MNLYVSNLDYALTDDELSNAFAQYGTVSSARVVKDRETGRSRGFAFVEMPNDAEAQSALRGMEGASIAGRPVRVVEARPKEDRPSRPPGGGGGGGGARDRGGNSGNRNEGNQSRGGGGNDYRDRDNGGGKKRDWSRDRGNRGGRGGFDEYDG